MRKLPFIETPQATVIAFDPGVTGAIAFLDTEAWELGVIDMPQVTITEAGKDRKEPAVGAIAKILRDNKPLLVVSEKLRVQGIHPDPSALFKMGRWRGQIEGMTAALQLPFEHVYANAWKKTMGLTADKEFSRSRATALFRDCTSLWPFKKDHDRAEAAILTLYGCLQLGLTPRKAIKPMGLRDENEATNW